MEQKISGKIAPFYSEIQVIIIVEMLWIKLLQEDLQVIICPENVNKPTGIKR
jgi:hypothetical protein